MIRCTVSSETYLKHRLRNECVVFTTRPILTVLSMKSKWVSCIMSATFSADEENSFQLPKSIFFKVFFSRRGRNLNSKNNFSRYRECYPAAAADNINKKLRSDDEKFPWPKVHLNNCISDATKNPFWPPQLEFIRKEPKTIG